MQQDSTGQDMDYHSHVRFDVLPFVPKTGGRLLDIGGGIGATALEARSRGLVGQAGVIDQVPALSGLDFSYNGDLNDLDFLESVGRAQGPFDTILCLDILEHLFEPWDVVAKLQTMLVPGGVIVASIPNVRHISVVAPLLLRSSWQLADDGVLDRTHLRFFTRSSAIELMTRSGLQLDLVRPLLDGQKATKLFGWVPIGAVRDFAALQYLVRVKNMAAPA